MKKPMTKEQAERKAIETASLSGGRLFKVVQVTSANWQKGWNVPPAS